jgi:cobalt-zinc-cadmium efflux system protein
MPHSRDAVRNRFRLFILLSASVLVAEVVGSYLTGSLALLGDAGHVAVDLSSLVLTYLSLRLAIRKSSDRFTFGYYRAEILAAVVNGLALLLVTVYIIYEAYNRFLHPEPVLTAEMLVIAVVGLAANLYVVMAMRGSEGNLSVRSAYLHVISDAITSVGVIVAGLLIILTGNYVFDPILSVVISVFILVGSIKLISESTHILMEAAPLHMDLVKVEEDMKSVEGVENIHDLHVWSISSDVTYLSSHVIISESNVGSANEIISKLNDLLKRKHEIAHSVIQVECECCAETDERVCKR